MLAIPAASFPRMTISPPLPPPLPLNQPFLFFFTLCAGYSCCTFPRMALVLPLPLPLPPPSPSIKLLKPFLFFFHIHHPVCSLFLLHHFQEWRLVLPPPSPLTLNQTSENLSLFHSYSSPCMLVTPFPRITISPPPFNQASKTFLFSIHNSLRPTP